MFSKLLFDQDKISSCRCFDTHCQYISASCELISRPWMIKSSIEKNLATYKVANISSEHLIQMSPYSGNISITLDRVWLLIYHFCFWIGFYRMPKFQTELREIWEQRLTSKSGDQIPTKRIRRICNVHFKTEDLENYCTENGTIHTMLRKDAVPLPLEPLAPSDTVDDHKP